MVELQRQKKMDESDDEIVMNEEIMGASAAKR